MTRREPAVATIVRIVLIIVGVVMSLYLIYLLRKPLSWVFIAGFLAIAMTGPVNFFGRFMPRKLAIATTYVGLIAIPAAIIAIVVPPIVTEGTGLAQKAPTYAQDVQDYVHNNKKLRELDDQYGIVTKLQQEAEKLPSRIGDAASALGDIGV